MTVRQCGYFRLLRLFLAGSLLLVHCDRITNSGLVSLVQVATSLTCFCGTRAPPISIADYIARIAKYSKCSPVCFIMAWSYLKRICGQVTAKQLLSRRSACSSLVDTCLYVLCTANEAFVAMYACSQTPLSHTLP